MITQLKRQLTVLIAFLLVVSLLWNLFAWFRADCLYAQGRSLAGAGYLNSAVEKLEGAVFLWRAEPAYYRELAAAYTRRAVAAESSSSLEDQLAAEAFRNGQRAYELNPRNMITLKSLIPTFYTLSKLDSQYKHHTKQIIAEALRVSANDPNLWYLQGIVCKGYGDEDAARRALQRAVELRPSYARARRELTSL